MGKQLDILHKLILDKEINRRERDMLIALKAFDFEDSNVISVGLKTLLGYFCIKNKECIYSVLRKLQSKGYIRIEKKTGMRNVYVIIKDYLLSKDVEDSGYNDVSSDGKGRYIDVPSEMSGHTDVSSCEEGRYVDVPGSRYDDVSRGISGYADVSSCEEGRYEDVPGSRYDDVPRGISGHTDVSSCEEGRYVDVPGSRYDDVSRGISGYANVSTSHSNIYNNKNNNNKNNIYINKNNNKKYINIINHWNSKKIGKSVSLNIKVIDSINKAMSKYSFVKLKKQLIIMQKFITVIIFMIFSGNYYTF